jgi:hypothetical protein
MVMKMVHEQKPNNNKTHKVQKIKKQPKKSNPRKFHTLSTFTFHIMNSNAFAGTHPPIVAQFSLLSVGDHLLNRFQGYLLDGKEKIVLHHIWEKHGLYNLGFYRRCGR